jgi:beta-phosphoglucomutase-like phosphatase (HAD superfamily)
LLRTADGDLRTDLSRLLLIKDFIARIRRLRAQQKRQERDSQLLFPELRGYVAQLPARLPIGDDVLVPSENACYADWQRYLKVLNAKDRDRHNNNKKIVAVKAIIKLWPESRKTRDTTLADVDELKARKAGII